MSRIGTASSIVFSITIVLLGIYFWLSIYAPNNRTENYRAEANAMRNAQNITSVYNAAISAGADFGDRNDLHSNVERLREGIHGSGRFADVLFNVDMTRKEVVWAEKLIVYDKENRVMSFK